VSGDASPAFAHASEAEMSRILDFYGVRWAYEPHTFPILWNLDGDVVESFAPDFYLEDLDLYLELTTLRQKLVRKKNRKLRRLRELYPDIRIKLFYARDFRALMLKYGKLALADALSGSAGQVSLRPTLVEEALDRDPVVDGAEQLAATGPVDEATILGPSSSTTARRRRRRRQAAHDRAGDLAAHSVSTSPVPSGPGEGSTTAP
jgi:hypoxanthine phosphoribosyltransferase